MIYFKSRDRSRHVPTPTNNYDMRCFIAINIPSEIKKYIGDIIFQLEKQNPRIKIKWVEPKNIHLTIAFLGEIAEEQAQLLLLRLSLVKFESLGVSLDGVSAFPSINQPRVIKIGLTGETRRLYQVAVNIRQTLTDLKISFDDKPFSSHITLGRVHDDRARVNLKIAVEPLSFRISTFDLMKSQLTKAGPIYTKLNLSS